MSYTRRFTKTITVHYSGSVSYPASQSGGTAHYSGSVNEQVEVVIDVDTNPYDNAVGTVNNNMALLTGSVVATEVAQVASIAENAKKVGDAVTEGFYRLVGSEISQQIAELTNQINATAIHLKEMRRRILELKSTMERDYQRKLTDYTKLFDDLDRELYRRLYALDEKVFNFQNMASTDMGRLFDSDMVNTAAVSADEQARLQATLAATTLKNLARQTLAAVHQFLQTQRNNDNLVKNCKIDNLQGDMQYCPALIIETTQPNDRRNREVYGSKAFLSDSDMEKFKDAAAGQHFQPMGMRHKQHLELFINENMREQVGGGDPHSLRVREYMRKFMNSDFDAATEGFNSQPQHKAPQAAEGYDSAKTKIKKLSNGRTQGTKIR